MDAKSSSLEKQKKGNLYVYKFSPISVPGGRTPEHQPSGTKKSIPASVWSLTKSLKSKPKSKPKPSQSEVIDKGKDEEKKNDKSRKVKESEMIMGMRMEMGKEGRKSVSSVEGILMSLANGRKSASGLEEEIKGKGFPLATQEEGGKKSVAELGRKSVSHVENNLAYVGKFVEKPRKSTGAKLETISNNNVESAMALLQVKVLVTDMPGFMQLHASQCARKTYDSLEKFSAKHLAFNLKKSQIKFCLNKTIEQISNLINLTYIIISFAT
ncbi:hypothetical protein Cgig2_023679 [Carnegiea gigantea]|uniref:Dynein light chain n=1 Tax=Carnegiea gigantea TaxID=171969 RepID=A0A9Q1QK71_9CARY|nr:hypothetical protein Cgig2_023679 [Carnegiea gigantea]